jgi:hypothetical protein
VNEPILPLGLGLELFSILHSTDRREGTTERKQEEEEGGTYFLCFPSLQKQNKHTHTYYNNTTTHTHSPQPKILFMMDTRKERKDDGRHDRPRVYVVYVEEYFNVVSRVLSTNRPA